MTDKEEQEYRNDIATYGNYFATVYPRRWYNPMRWLRGKFHQKRIDPRDKGCVPRTGDLA